MQHSHQTLGYAMKHDGTQDLRVEGAMRVRHGRRRESCAASAAFARVRADVRIEPPAALPPQPLRHD